MGQVELTIDGRALCVDAGMTLLQAADAAQVYVPRLCAHPSLATRSHCGICAVEVEGRGVARACETQAVAGMSVATGSDAVRGARAEALDRLLAVHPHVCLTCDLAEGCSRSRCSYGNVPEVRCCEKFGACEFQQVAYFVGISPDAPKYVPRGLPIAEEGLFTRNLNLCVGCLRCEGACRDVAQAGAVGERVQGDLILPAPAAGETMQEAGCVFCGACVKVCPTGALTARKGEKGKSWIEKTRAKLNLASVPLPPRATMPLDAGALEKVPVAGGVYQLCDAGGVVLKIKGVIDLRGALLEELEAGVAAAFTFEEYPLYTSRESQLIQQHLAQRGSMPGGGDLDDLY